MSTRANIRIKDKHTEVWFYRHSDGYPEGTLPTLNKFLDLVKSNKIRDNVSQASGWLVLIGAEEYKQSLEKLNNSEVGGYNWKVGAYEPTDKLHIGVDFVYTVDLDKKEITFKSEW